jgi:hypothetical protein
MPDLKIYIVSAEEGHTILDKQSRRRLGISGKEFIKKWHDGYEFEDTEAADSVAMFLPYANCFNTYEE